MPTYKTPNCTLYEEKRELVQKLVQSEKERLEAETEALNLNAKLLKVFEHIESTKRPSKAAISKILFA